MATDAAGAELTRTSGETYRDLNEERFPDPKNLTRDDLPLILNRLALIEQLAPHSMDATNAAAFAEAYKDLANMAERLARQ